MNVFFFPFTLRVNEPSCWCKWMGVIQVVCDHFPLACFPTSYCNPRKRWHHPHSSTTFKMAQVIKLPIKRWESVRGRGIEQAHWLKPREPSAACSSSIHNNWYTLFVFVWPLPASANFSAAAGARTQHSSASSHCSTPPYRCGYLILQVSRFVCIKSPNSSASHDTI